MSEDPKPPRGYRLYALGSILAAGTASAPDVARDLANHGLKAHPNAVYSAIKQLAEDGLIAGSVSPAVSARGGRRRTVYGATAAGRSAAKLGLAPLRPISELFQEPVSHEHPPASGQKETSLVQEDFVKKPRPKGRSGSRKTTES